jgi:hypothetical protein
MGKTEPTPPKKARKAIEKLHEMVELMEYEYGRDTKFFRDYIIKELASPIEDVLHDLSIEKNIDHIKLATKLRTIWVKEQEDKIEELVEERLEQEVEKRLDDIKEMEDEGGRTDNS